MQLLQATTIFVFSLCMFACAKEEARPAWIKPETLTISCDDYFSVRTPNGTLYNNVWNKRAAESFAWNQCIEKEPSNGLYGWSWEWPSAGNVIFAYPQIKVGTSPWDPSKEHEPWFPMDIASIRGLVVEHELDVQGKGEHNVATSLWLTNTNEIDDKPDPSSIIAELMIWTYETPGHMNPAGAYKGDFEMGGQTWEVWVEKEWGDASGANDNTWTCLTFRSKSHSLKSKFDVVDFTDYAIENGLLPEKFHVSDIELGTEIMSGSGLAWVRKFEYFVEK